MKKLLLVLMTCIFALTLLSCSQPASPVAASSQAQNTLQLLAGYPQNIFPLYQPDKLISCGFSYRSHDFDAVGKEEYLVTYESTATQQDLYKYYNSLLTQNDATPAPSASDATESDDEGSAGTDSVNGKIGSIGVDVSILDNQDNTTTVYLTVGLNKEKYTDSNPYFSAYPSGLVDEYGVQDKQESTYQEQYYGSKTIHFITVYTTGITQQEFLAYYQKYASKQSFKQTTSENNASVSWQDQGFSCSVLFTGGLSPYITIDAFKQG
jgi:hypothetical protein